MLAHGVHHSRELTWCLLNDNLFLLRLADRDPRTGPGLISLYTTRAYSRKQKFREKSLEIRGFPPLSHDITIYDIPQISARRDTRGRTRSVRRGISMETGEPGNGGPPRVLGFSLEPGNPTRPETAPRFSKFSHPLESHGLLSSDRLSI